MWRRTKKGGIHSWENGDLDVVGVSFLSLSLSLSLSLHYTSFWLIPVLYMYIVEDGLSDNLTKRLELEINKKGEKREKKMNVAARLINCVVNGYRFIRRKDLIL